MTGDLISDICRKREDNRVNSLFKTLSTDVTKSRKVINTK